MGDEAPRIEGVRFAVLALGDTAYVKFCATGKAIDARLEALGGTRAFDRVDLDLDYSKQAAEWTEKALGELAPAEAAGNATVVHVDFKGGAPAPTTTTSRSSPPRTRSTAEISTLVNLNGTGSTRETWHVEIAAEAPGFCLSAGRRHRHRCRRTIRDLALELAEAVGPRCRRRRRAEAARALRHHDAVAPAGRSLRQAHAAHRSWRTLADAKAFAEFADDRQLVDLFETLSREAHRRAARPACCARCRAGSTRSLRARRRIPAKRICWSAPCAGNRTARSAGGVASTYLADRRRVGDAVRVYVKPNRHFRLPEDGNRPIIMIGAGTGVAPYRAFVEERAEAGAKGKSWLFFGERNFTNDFLYQLEWQERAASRRAVAHRRRLLARPAGEDLRAASPVGSARATCSSGSRTARTSTCAATRRAWRGTSTRRSARILAEAARGDDEAGRAKLNELTKAGRYQRDVY